MNLAQSLDSALAQLRASGRVEVRENGIWLARLENFAHEVREQNGRTVLHLWTADHDQVRCVTGILLQQPERLTVEVRRWGRPRPARLDFVLARRIPPPARLAREKFRARLREILAAQFPDERVCSLTATPDLTHSLSGNYVRGIMQSASSAWAVLAAAPGENSGTYDGLLTFGLIWLATARNSSTARPPAGLRLFLPERTGRCIAHRLAALSNSLPAELYEYAPHSGRVKRCSAADSANAQSWLVPRRETEAALQAAQGFLDLLRRDHPGAVQAHAIPGTAFLDLRYRGLTFARWQPDAILFGLGEPDRLLSAATQPEFDRLLKHLQAHRSPFSDNTSHRLYRAVPERWLESVISADPSRVDPRLDSRFVYSQVPAFSTGDRGIMDLLAVARDGRLTVLELKAHEDIHMPLQAVDYWLRVRWHHAREEFSASGYFPGINLDPRPPRILLIAPSLRFHPATDAVLKYLSPEIEIERVGISEHWRRGIKVVLRQGLAASS